MLEAPPAIPSNHPPEVTSAGLPALLSSVAFAPLPDIAWIKITGEDRVRWLNGMVTNSIQTLTPGQGCYNFFLNAQGRIQADATAFALEDSILLQTQRDRIPALIALLDHFIIMDDVELHDQGPSAGLILAGPEAAVALATLGIPGAPRSSQSHREDRGETHSTIVHTTFNGTPVDLIQAHSPLVPRFELWATSETIASIAYALTEAGTAQATPQDLEHLRILEGTPLYGTDIRDRDLPQETGQTRALHFAKGCYLGQEIVERIRSRGNVHRTFSGFTLAGEVPAPGTPLFTAETPGKPIGEITSAARIDLPSGPITLALGYIRREALDRGAALHYDGGTATPTALPYPIAPSA
jgi:folate-binding protein YgfZ